MRTMKTIHIMMITLIIAINYEKAILKIAQLLLFILVVVIIKKLFIIHK